MTKYLVTVKPGSSQEKIIMAAPADSSNSTGDINSTNDATPVELTVYLRAKPHDGEANIALIKALAKHFKVPKTSITILRGAHSRQKLIEL